MSIGRAQRAPGLTTPKFGPSELEPLPLKRLSARSWSPSQEVPPPPLSQSTWSSLLLPPSVHWRPPNAEQRVFFRGDGIFDHCRWAAFRAVHRTPAQAFFTAVNFINCAAIVMETDCYAQTTGSCPADAEVAFWVAEYVFFAILFLELAANFLESWHYLLTGWGIFDTSLVLLSFFGDFLVRPVLAAHSNSGGTNEDFGTVAILRVYRLLRLARIAQTMRRFPTVLHMVHGLLAALTAIAWSFASGALLILLFAIVAVEAFQAAGGSWGHVGQAMLNLLQIATFDNWMLAFKPLVDAYPVTGHIYMLLFIATVSITLMKLVTAVLTEHSFKSAQQDQSIRDWEQHCKLCELHAQLQETFDLADEKDCGEITKTELQALWESNPKARGQLKEFGSLQELCDLFDMISGESTGAALNYDVFIDGMMSYKEDKKLFLSLLQLRHLRHLRHRISYVEKLLDVGRNRGSVIGNRLLGAALNGEQKLNWPRDAQDAKHADSAAIPEKEEQEDMMNRIAERVANLAADMAVQRATKVTIVQTLEQVSKCMVADVAPRLVETIAAEAEQLSRHLTRTWEDSLRTFKGSAAHLTPHPTVQAACTQTEAENPGAEEGAVKTPLEADSVSIGIQGVESTSFPQDPAMRSLLETTLSPSVMQLGRNPQPLDLENSLSGSLGALLGGSLSGQLGLAASASMQSTAASATAGSALRPPASWVQHTPGQDAAPGSSEGIAAQEFLPAEVLSQQWLQSPRSVSAAAKLREQQHQLQLLQQLQMQQMQPQQLQPQQLQPQQLMPPLAGYSPGHSVAHSPGYNGRISLLSHMEDLQSQVAQLIHSDDASVAAVAAHQGIARVSFSPRGQ